MPAATWVVALFLSFFGLQLAVEAVLLALQLRAADRGRGVPPALAGRVEETVAARSREYTLARGRYALVAMAFSAAGTLVVLFSGALPWLDRALAGAGLAGAHLFVVYLGVLGAVGAVWSIPFSLYSTFVLEARFGFNKTTPRLWVVDRLKGLAVELVIGVPLLYAVYGFMRFTGSYWWVWLFAFLVVFQVVMDLVWPAFIAPLFNKFQPLPEGPLRERLVALARDAGFKNRGLFVMDASRRSGHSNAYFTGLIRPRIVLFDTLVTQMTVDEAASVLAHEIGHFRRHHVHRMLAVSLAGMLVMLFALSRLVPWPPLYAAFGFAAPSLHAALTLVALCGGAFLFWLTPIAARFSRRHEYEADRYAVEVARAPVALKSALLRLDGENLGNLHPHPWYSAWHYGHPALVERLAAIDAAAGVPALEGQPAAP